MVLVAWFVGCLVGYQCKASVDRIWGKRLVACFVCWWATHPSLSLSFLWLVLVGSACLACLLGFGENTYSDGWIIDRKKNVTFWCVGLLEDVKSFCIPSCPQTPTKTEMGNQEDDEEPPNQPDLSSFFQPRAAPAPPGPSQELPPVLEHRLGRRPSRAAPIATAN